MNNLVAIVVFAPYDYAEKIRLSMDKAGAGALGNYHGCSFSILGTGRFTACPGADPHIGDIGIPCKTDEVRIETICPRDKAREVLHAMIDAHPYEEPAYHCYEILTLDDL